MYYVFCSSESKPVFESDSRFCAFAFFKGAVEAAVLQVYLSDYHIGYTVVHNHRILAQFNF